MLIQKDEKWKDLVCSPGDKWRKDPKAGRPAVPFSFFFFFNSPHPTFNLTLEFYYLLVTSNLRVLFVCLNPVEFLAWAQNPVPKLSENAHISLFLGKWGCGVLSLLLLNCFLHHQARNSRL